MNGLAGRVCVVTGAASGIGRAVAERLAREGARLVLADLDEAGAAAAARAAEAAGARAVAYAIDVTSAAQVEALFARAQDAFGGSPVEGAVLSAGIEGEEAATAFVREEDWDRVMAVNLKGVWLCMKQALRRMLPQGRGAIVNVASVAGLVGQKARAPYTAAKHGVIGLTRAAAAEYTASGIRINAVCPSYVDSPMITRLTDGDPAMAAQLAGAVPMGRLATPAEVAAAVAWLLSDDASYVAGTAMVIDGGYLAS